MADLFRMHKVSSIETCKDEEKQRKTFHHVHRMLFCVFHIGDAFNISTMNTTVLSFDRYDPSVCFTLCARFENSIVG